MKNDCIFCKIVKGELPSKKVYEDREIIAFADINPKAPVHLLVVPAEHLESLRGVTGKDRGMLGKLMETASKVAAAAGISESGYKVVINNGPGAGQLVPHLHLHLLGGWRKSPGWSV